MSPKDKFLNTFIEELSHKGQSKFLAEPNWKDLNPADFYIFELCEEYNKNQSERSFAALQATVEYSSSRMKQILDRINEDLREDLKNKILAYLL